MITWRSTGLSPGGALFVQVGGGHGEADPTAVLVLDFVEDVIDRATRGELLELGAEVLLQGLVAPLGLALKRTVDFVRDVADQHIRHAYIMLAMPGSPQGHESPSRESRTGSTSGWPIPRPELRRECDAGMSEVQMGGRMAVMTPRTRVADAFAPDLPIHTDRLVLRSHRVDDLGDLVAFHGDPDVVRFIPWPVRDRAATEQALSVKLGQTQLSEPGQWLVLAVELRETATVIGEVLLKWASAHDRQGELGYAFARDHHGRGYAAEATSALLRLGFEDFGLHRISAVCIQENEASARLLRRLGFSLQGRLVDSALFKGRYVTELVFALTEDDWRSDAGVQSAAAQSDAPQILALVRTYFAAFTSGEGTDSRLEALRAVMLPSAIIVRTCGLSPAVYDIESFIAPRRELLTNGSLSNFSEQARLGHLDVFGDIAHWFGRYTKDGELHGQPCPGAGMKSIQFVRTHEGWRISAAAWDDDRPGITPSDHYAADHLGT
jgi:RimJ/RimL family protein N-acetyltransferase